MGGFRFKSCLTFLLVFTSWTLRAENTIEVPREIVEVLFKERSSLSLEDAVQISDIKQKLGNNRIVSVQSWQLPSSKYPANFEQKLIGWILSKDIVLSKAAIELSKGYLIATPHSDKVVEALLSVQSNAIPAGTNIHVLESLSGVFDKYPSYLTPFAFKLLRRSDLSEAEVDYAKKILEEQPSEEALKYWIQQEKNNYWPSKKVSQILENQIPMSDSTYKALLNVLLISAKKGQQDSIALLVKILTGKPELKKILKDALKEKFFWPLNAQVLDNSNLLRTIMNDAELHKLYRQRIIKEIRRNSSISSNLWLHSWQKIFSDQEFVGLIYKYPSSKEYIRQRQLGSLIALGGKLETSLAVESLFKKMSDQEKQSYLHYTFRLAVPFRIRKQLIEYFFRKHDKQTASKEAEQFFPLFIDDDELILKLNEVEKKLVLPFASQFKTVGMREILKQDDEANNRGEKWIAILGQLGLLEPSDRKTIWEKIQKLNSKNEILRQLLPILQMPEDKTILDTVFRDGFSDRKTLIGQSSQAEIFRDSLSKSGKKYFDDYVKKLLKDSSFASGLSACEMVCGVRKNPSWTSEQFLSSSEGEEDVSEHLFGVKNVIALFELKSRSLCVKDPLKDERLTSFHRSPLPMALRAMTVGEASRENRRRKESQLQGVEWASKLGRAAAHLFSKDDKRIEFLHEWEKSIIRQRSEIIDQKESTPGIPSNALIYGVIFAKLALQEVDKLPVYDQKVWQKWREKVDTGYQWLTHDFKKKVEGIGGSHFGGYATSMAALAMHPPSLDMISDMKTTAASIGNRCEIPYNRTLSSNEEEAVFRSTVHYYVLWKYGENEPGYRAALFECLKKYFTNPWGIIHSAANRNDKIHHAGKRHFAPYYRYATLFVASEALHELYASDKFKGSDKKFLEGLMKEAFEQISLDFNKEKMLFIDTSSSGYINRPAYYNPLMALSLIPYCKAEKNIPRNEEEKREKSFRGGW